MSVWSTRAFPQYGTYSIRINYSTGLRVLVQMILLHLRGVTHACARGGYARGGSPVYELIHKVATYNIRHSLFLMYKGLCRHAGVYENPVRVQQRRVEWSRVQKIGVVSAKVKHTRKHKNTLHWGVKSTGVEYTEVKQSRLNDSIVNHVGVK